MLMPSYFKNTVIVPIVVLPPLPESQQPRICCPTVLLPLGDWTIVWSLVTVDYPPGVHATFDKSKGIVMSLLEQKATRVSDTQWTCSYKNISEEDILAVKYNINFYAPSLLNGEPGLPISSTDPRVICHDPTIAVTKDPIEGG